MTEQARYFIRIQTPYFGAKDHHYLWSMEVNNLEATSFASRKEAKAVIDEAQSKPEYLFHNQSGSSSMWVVRENEIPKSIKYRYPGTFGLYPGGLKE